jgi:iron complex transport system substrate-binding protein
MSSLYPSVYFLSFLIGSIPFGILVAKIFKIDDIRAKGSGNIGATNVSRVGGFWPAGFLTFFFDTGKGALSVMLTSPLANNLWAKFLDLGEITPDPFFSWAVAFFAVLGHCYSPWLKFSGGKGVSTAFGVFLVLSPISALVAALSFIYTFYTKRIVSLASLVSMIAAAVAFVSLNTPSTLYIPMIGVVFLVILRHEKNISAMLSGSEKTYGSLIIFLFLLNSANARDLIDATQTRVHLSDEPKRIVTLAPSLGELAADVLGSEIEFIVGVSEFTTYPPALKKVTSIGPYARFNIEKIVSLKPELVLATIDGNSQDQVNHLRELGVPVVVVDTRSLAGIINSIQLVATSLNREQIGRTALASLDRVINEVRSHTVKRKSKNILLQISEKPLIVAGGHTFLNDLVEIIGAKNVYAESKVSYPRPAVEDVIRKNPDVIIIFDMNGQPISGHVKKLWNEFPRINAVRNHQVKAVESDSILRPSLRLLKGIPLLEKAIYGNS